MKQALQKAGFRLSPEARLENKLNSMRWLIVKGRIEEAEKVRKEIIDFCAIVNLKIPDECKER